MANDIENFGNFSDTGAFVPTASTGTQGGSWMEKMFLGMTGAFSAFSGYIAGQTGAEEAEFRGRQATRQIGQIGRDVATGAERLERAGKEFTGQQRTAVAKSGVALSGSAEQAIAESDRQFALDVAALKHRGTLATIEKQAEAEMAKVQARGARAQATAGLLSGLVTTASRVRLGV